MSLTYKKVISQLFPETLETPEELEKKYPLRILPNNAVVTRFAPSPTGFIHIGGVYIAVIGKNITQKSGGTYFIRIEDTDQKRKVDDSETQFDKTFQYFKIESDESNQNSIYGPYIQSERSNIYLSYVKKLMEDDRAYPCFCTKEMLEEQTKKQIEAKVDIGYYGKWAQCSRLTENEIENKLKLGIPYVVRFRCNGTDSMTTFEDKIRGTVRLKNNINDVVILKSSDNALPLPTYHLAHAVDDHLMRVNLILRADEWLSSVPLHFQLFDALGFERIPYAHIAPIMKLDGTSKRKLSKRKDPEASVGYYMENGYPAEAVIAYLKGLANSDLSNLPIAECLNAEIQIDKMPKSGALLDLDKLNHISSNYIAALNSDKITTNIQNWACEYDSKLNEVISNNCSYTSKVINTDRITNGKIRKDLIKWSDFTNLYGYFFNEYFVPVTESTNEIYEKYTAETVKNVLSTFQSLYQDNIGNDEWMNVIQKVAENGNFAVNNQEYKASPEKFNGKLSDAIKIVRIVLTGIGSGLSLHEVCNTLGYKMVNDRISNFIISNCDY